MPAVVFAIFISLMAATYHSAKYSISADCDRVGAFYVDDVVYECKRKP